MIHEQEQQQLIDNFSMTYGQDPDHLFFAPGRVNLIGEHTDYNGGFVFPAALTMGTYLAVKQTNDQTLHLVSANFNQQITCSIHELAYRKDDDWGNYPKGVLDFFYKQGLEFTGLKLYFYGNLPHGAGLSSSASIEMVTAFMAASLTGANYSKPELAKACQQVENHYIGVNSGLMDQFAIGMGKQDHALFLNTQSLAYEHVPLHLGNYCLVITNSNKRRGLADSKYNERRSECEQGLSDLQASGLELTTLSDLSLEALSVNQDLFRSETIANRVAHVVRENDRVKRAVLLLKEGDLEGFGQLMADSHRSLAIDYEVTGAELDALFDIQIGAPGCIGTRMTGAGFGGCTISLVDQKSIDAFTSYVAPLYKKQTGLEPDFYVSTAGTGVSELSLNTERK